MRGQVYPACLLLLGALLSGCSDAGPGPEQTPTAPGTAVVRGVVVDAAIRPIPDVQVTVPTAGGLHATTGEDGAFEIADVPLGSHRVQAVHRLYLPASALVEVGEDGPQPQSLRLILDRVVFDEPYVQVQKEVGFISCSVSQGTTKSEECGEGVGDPSGQRLGRNPNSRPQIDFFVEGPGLRTLIVEQVWEPNADGVSAQELDTVLALDWACTPTCAGNELAQDAGPSPLHLRVDAKRLEGLNITSGTRFSTFTWAEGEPGVVLEQEFELIIHSFHHLPAPEGWSFVRGDPLPS